MRKAATSYPGIQIRPTEEPLPIEVPATLTDARAHAHQRQEQVLHEHSGFDLRFSHFPSQSQITRNPHGLSGLGLSGASSRI